MHEDYKNTLLNEEQMRHKIRTIRTVKHKLQSFKINKISLSCFDDKCYIHDNGTSSYGYGHYKIKLINEQYFFKISTSILLDKI